MVGRTPTAAAAAPCVQGSATAEARPRLLDVIRPAGSEGSKQLAALVAKLRHRRRLQDGRHRCSGVRLRRALRPYLLRQQHAPGAVGFLCLRHGGECVASERCCERSVKQQAATESGGRLRVQRREQSAPQRELRMREQASKQVIQKTNKTNNKPCVSRSLTLWKQRRAAASAAKLHRTTPPG